MLAGHGSQLNLLLISIKLSRLDDDGLQNSMSHNGELFLFHCQLRAAFSRVFSRKIFFLFLIQHQGPCGLSLFCLTIYHQSHLSRAFPKLFPIHIRLMSSSRSSNYRSFGLSIFHAPSIHVFGICYLPQFPNF